jgi:hypothetical protein
MRKRSSEEHNDCSPIIIDYDNGNEIWITKEGRLIPNVPKCGDFVDDKRNF